MTADSPYVELPYNQELSKSDGVIEVEHEAFIKLNGIDYNSLQDALNFIDNYDEVIGLCSTLECKFQDGVISENGVNGIQFTGLIEIALSVLKNLNSKFPCRENAITITKLEESLMWKEDRTKDREKRALEGKNEK